MTLNESLKAILNFFLIYKEEEEKKQLISNEILDIISLGILKAVRSGFKSKKKAINQQTLTFKRFQLTCSNIISRLNQILDVYLHCWNVSSGFADNIFFSSKGIYLYQNETFSRFNKALIEQQRDDSGNQLDQLKNEIFTVLIPLAH